MIYCEILRAICDRFPPGDTCHCHDCSESLIFVHDKVVESGLQPFDVQIIPSFMRHEIGAYEISTGLLVIGVTEGKVSSR